jgi:hypothetical protein
MSLNPIEITALSASEKRALVDALNAVRIPSVLSSAPTSSTEGRKGQLAIWVEAGETTPRYSLCIKAEDGVYTWREQDLVVMSETAPTEALFPGLLWIRPSTGALSMRNSANTAWITIGVPITPEVYDLDDLSGTVTLDRANGEVQHGFISDDTTFAAPDSAFAGAKLTVAIDYTTGAHDINFTGIDMNPEAIALLPVTLAAEKAYQFEFSFLGGGWVLAAVSGPFEQTLYP